MVHLLSVMTVTGKYHHHLPFSTIFHCEVTIYDVLLLVRFTYTCGTFSLMVHLPSAMTVTGKYHHRLSFYQSFHFGSSYKGCKSFFMTPSDCPTLIYLLGTRNACPSVRMAGFCHPGTSLFLVITFQKEVIIQVLIIGAQPAPPLWKRRRSLLFFCAFSFETFGRLGNREKVRS